MSRFKKLLGDFPTEGSIVDTVTKKVYSLRSEWEQKKLLEDINQIFKEIEEKVKGDKK